MADSSHTDGALAQALAGLDAALTEAKVTHFLQKAEAGEIEDAFEELRACGLEPSKRLAEFYAAGNPADITIEPWVYDKLELIPARLLADGHDDVALGANGRLKAGWRGHWIVIAKAGDDPYVVDASKPELPVFTDTHGVGAWQPQLVASSLASFVQICTSWVERFVGPGLDPEPESYLEVGDSKGERASKSAWRGLLTELEQRDPQAFSDEFWPRRG